MLQVILAVLVVKKIISQQEAIHLFHQLKDKKIPKTLQGAIAKIQKAEIYES